jgi:hypothetical protein
MIDYAQFTLWHSSIGISGFEIVNSRTPRTFFDWNTPTAVSVPERLSQKKAKAIATRIYKTIEKNKEFMTKTQNKKSRNINAHRREVDFEIGDKI